MLREGRSVASFDLDSRQATLSRYIENRAKLQTGGGRRPPMPIHNRPALDDVDGLARLVDELRGKVDAIVIDSPGADTPLARHAHGLADTLITPLNDSFIDVDGLAIVDPDSFAVLRPSHYAEFVWEQRKRRALERRPADSDLRLALVSSLFNAGFVQESERLLREGLLHQPEAPLFNALLALRCAVSARLSEARPAIVKALGMAPEMEYVREQAAIVALVGGEVPEALWHTGWLVDRRPLGQFAWALRVLALRLAGNSEWERYAHPDTVCHTSTLAPPPGYTSIADFNVALAERLRDRHTLTAHPLVNSVRGGTQVEIHPGAETDPVLRAFLEAIRGPISEYIAAMPQDDSHPLFRRKRSGLRYSGCWTVRLRGGSGRHVSHMHPKGWISSAYYVTVPPEIPASDTRAGWLSFGRPPYPIPGLDAFGWVRPEPGRLALFPSYQWHGVEAFPGEGERLTVAFDVVPAGA
jgi:hypothetical protein